MKTKQYKILHVDDDADDQQLFKKAVHSVDQQLEIVEAFDGEEGLECLREMKQKNCLPCLIVLDINMPKVNGRDACLAIKRDEVLSSIPLVIFSTSSSTLDKMFFKGKNVEYITKPSDYSHFIEVTTKMLDHCQG